MGHPELSSSGPGPRSGPPLTTKLFLEGELEGDLKGDYKQDMEGDLQSSSGQLRSHCVLEFQTEDSNTPIEGDNCSRFLWRSYADQIHWN